jgi:hypothetical protein
MLSVSAWSSPMALRQEASLLGFSCCRARARITDGNDGRCCTLSQCSLCGPSTPGLAFSLMSPAWLSCGHSRNGRLFTELTERHGAAEISEVTPRARGLAAAGCRNLDGRFADAVGAFDRAVSLSAGRLRVRGRAVVSRALDHRADAGETISVARAGGRAVASGAIASCMRPRGNSTSCAG